MPSAVSRTPEGQPGRCPLCGAEAAVQPAGPLGDAPCPACGTLLWPLPVDDAGAFLMIADELTPAAREQLLSALALLRDGEQDSLSRIEALMEVEEALEINVPDEIAERMQTVEDFIEWWLRGRDREGP